MLTQVVSFGQLLYAAEFVVGRAWTLEPETTQGFEFNGTGATVSRQLVARDAPEPSGSLIVRGTTKLSSLLKGLREGLGGQIERAMTVPSSRSEESQHRG